MSVVSIPADCVGCSVFCYFGARSHKVTRYRGGPLKSVGRQMYWVVLFVERRLTCWTKGDDDSLIVCGSCFELLRWSLGPSLQCKKILGEYCAPRSARLETATEPRHTPGNRCEWLGSEERKWRVPPWGLSAHAFMCKAASCFRFCT